MKIKLFALDTLFFRDGKPFDKGEETWANGIFPPYPSVIYGALRSLYYITHPAEIGNKGATRNIEIHNIKLSDDNYSFYPCPYDVVKSKNKNSKQKVKPILLKLKKGLNNTSSILEYYLSSEHEVEPIDGFLQGSNFEDDYLYGDSPMSYRNMEDYISLEPKVGIGRNTLTGITEEGLLYRVGMIRPKNIQIEVDFSLEGWKMEKGDKGFIKLGGESKACAFEIISDVNEKEEIVEIRNDVFKVCLSTPTTLKNGWFPSFLGGEMKGTWKELGINVQLLTAAVGKPIYVGGFDMEERKPKPMTRMLPAGSVFYFKILDKIEKIELPQKVKLVDDKAKEKEGFGIAYLSIVKNH